MLEIVEKQAEEALWYCRYGYPQPSSNGYVLNDLEDSVISKREQQRREIGTSCLGGEARRDINSYNPVMLQLWRANMDVKFVGEYSNVLNSYVTGYVKKGEKKATELWGVMEKDKSAGARSCP